MPVEPRSSSSTIWYGGTVWVSHIPQSEKRKGKEKKNGLTQKVEGEKGGCERHEVSQ